MHTCPMMTPGVPPIPHVGGPITGPGAATVLIAGLPAARVSDMATCVGPPDTIVMGSMGVMINGLPAARMGDPTAHGGVIVLGAPTVMIGDIGSPSPGAAGMGGVMAGMVIAGVLSTKIDGDASKLAKGKDPQQWRTEHKAAIEQALSDQKKLLEKRKADLQRWNNDDKADAKKWFGSDDELTRKTLQDRVQKELDLNSKSTVNNFYPADPPQDGTYAYVYAGDQEHKIYLDSAFDSAPATGEDSKAGVLAHEMSHFSDVGGTEDHVYGKDGAQALAQKNPASALNNADNFEYYVESAN